VSAAAGTEERTDRRRVRDGRRLWWLSVAALAVLTWSYLGVLYEVVDVDGDPTLFLAVVAVALGGGVVAGRLVPPTAALGATLAIAAAGTVHYVGTLPAEISILASLDVFARDAAALMTGLSVLRIINAGLWATAVVPGPVFLSWYLAARRRHVAAAAVGLGALVFFVLTGDAGGVRTLFGAIAATAVAGLGDLAVRGGSLADADVVAVVVAAMILVTTTVPVIPGAASDPLSPGSVAGGAGTVEASLTSAGDEVSIVGALDLTAERRFVIRSEEAGYWRVAAYDRFTGDSWVRTGSASTTREPRPPVRSDRAVEQTVIAQSTVNVLPALWKPVAVEGIDPAVTEFGGLQPAAPLSTGDRYAVRSRRASNTPEELRAAGRDYPESVERFLQLPASTPGRIESFTSRLTANAENPYDTARVIEVWLQENKGYSLDVEKPDGSAADTFLFEMEAGYCTYFATAMVTMLRTQGIPARFVVGYTAGEEVDPGRFVVRGLHSHAWVEAYFPGRGWVQFDPTPAAPREAAERDALGTAGPITTSTPATTSTKTTTGDNGSAVQNPATQAGPVRTPGGGDDGGSVPLPLPSREQAVLGLLVFVGLAAGARHSGATARAYRAVWLRYQPRTTPAADVERAVDRLEYVLARERRPRRPDETPRAYLAAVADDERARRVGEIHERAAYAGRATDDDATEAVALVDDLVAEHLRRHSGLARLAPRPRVPRA